MWATESKEARSGKQRLKTEKRSPKEVQIPTAQLIELERTTRRIGFGSKTLDSLGLQGLAWLTLGALNTSKPIGSIARTNTEYESG